jgi:hypothetical protein
MQDNYKGRLSVFIKEMQDDPVIIDNDRLAEEPIDADYRFRRSKAYAIDKKFRQSLDGVKDNGF